MNIHNSPKRTLTMEQWCQRSLECSTVFLHDCVALFYESWQDVLWKEHPSSCMTFLWSLYHRPSARLSHATLRWLSGSFSTFAHNVGTAQRCTSRTQWPSGQPRLCVRTYANCQVVWLWKRISLICFSRATAVRVMCSRLSGIQISSRLIALTNR